MYLRNKIIRICSDLILLLYPTKFCINCRLLYEFILSHLREIFLERKINNALSFCFYFLRFVFSSLFFIFPFPRHPAAAFPLYRKKLPISKVKSYVSTCDSVFGEPREIHSGGSCRRSLPLGSNGGGGGARCFSRRCCAPRRGRVAPTPSRSLDLDVTHFISRRFYLPGSSVTPSATALFCSFFLNEYYVLRAECALGSLVRSAIRPLIRSFARSFVRCHREKK